MAHKGKVTNKFFYYKRRFWRKKKWIAASAAIKHVASPAIQKTPEKELKGGPFFIKIDWSRLKILPFQKLFLILSKKKFQVVFSICHMRNTKLILAQKLKDWTRQEAAQHFFGLFMNNSSNVNYQKDFFIQFFPGGAVAGRGAAFTFPVLNYFICSDIKDKRFKNTFIFARYNPKEQNNKRKFPALVLKNQQRLKLLDTYWDYRRLIKNYLGLNTEFFFTKTFFKRSSLKIKLISSQQLLATNLCSLFANHRLVCGKLKALKKAWLALWFKKYGWSKNCVISEFELVSWFYCRCLKFGLRHILMLQKLVAAHYLSINNCRYSFNKQSSNLNLLKQNIVNNRLNELKKLTPEMWRILFIKPINNWYLRNKKSTFIQVDTRFYKISILGFRFLRRIRKLIIKRGGGARAFKELNLLNFNLTPGLMAAIKTAGGPKDRKFFNPFVFIVRNLRTHFFLRKHTKFRKTRLIPGILFKRRRLRVIGRWFMKSVKAKNERRFRDCLMGAAVETINNEGPAIDIRNAFNEQVFASKVNIIVRKRRRTRGRRKLKTLTDLKIKRLERNEKRKKLIKQKTFR